MSNPPPPRSPDATRLLLVEDEPNIREGLADALDSPDLEIVTKASGDEALPLLEKSAFDIVITDLRMPGGTDGIDLLRAVRARTPEATVILVTAFGTVDRAVEAMKEGAADFIAKPVNLTHLRMLVQRAQERAQLLAENRRMRRALAADGEPTGAMVGQSPAFRRLLQALESAAATDATILLQGESGTGKELLARWIHAQSPRRARPFVAVNAGAVAETLFESEVFGHEPGAFTGAAQRRRGVFERAHGGTLFLDEVTEISEKNQVDLLRVIQEREVVRVGGSERVAVDVRLIASSNQDVSERVRSGAFREDLFYRLNVVPALLPPLRERREDIPLLVERFLVEFSARYRRPVKRCTPAVLGQMAEYAWPGNIRQLRNVLERAVVTSSSEVIDAVDLPVEGGTGAPAESVRLRDQVAGAEREAVARALREAGGHREQAARLLGISVRSLHYKMRRHGLR